MEFGCGGEGDDRDMLQTNAAFAFAWPELLSPSTALGTRPAPRVPARPEAALGAADLAPPEVGDTGVGGGEAIFVQLCYCIKQNTAKPPEVQMCGHPGQCWAGVSGTAVLHGAAHFMYCHDKHMHGWEGEKTLNCSSELLMQIDWD